MTSRLVSAYTSAMFSETRYALNGDLRVAYRASREGPRDIVFVANWFTCCEHLPELPSLQGWVEAMTSLGRLIFFDQPGTGASDPVTPGALPTLEQWADSITAVLDDLGSREAVLVAFTARSRQRRFSQRHIRLAPPRWSCSTVTRIRRNRCQEEVSCLGRIWGTGEFQHVVIRTCRGTRRSGHRWLDMERLAASPRTVALLLPSDGRTGRAGGPSDNPCADSCRPAFRRSVRPPARGQVRRRAHTGREVRRVPGRNLYHFVEPWRASFQEIAEFLTGDQADVADDRVLATVLFTDIVDSTRRAAEMGDRDWHALLDAHDAVVRSHSLGFAAAR